MQLSSKAVGGSLISDTMTLQKTVQWGHWQPSSFSWEGCKTLVKKLMVSKSRVHAMTPPLYSEGCACCFLPNLTQHCNVYSGWHNYLHHNGKHIGHMTPVLKGSDFTSCERRMSAWEKLCSFAEWMVIYCRWDGVAGCLSLRQDAAALLEKPWGGLRRNGRWLLYLLGEPLLILEYKSQKIIFVCVILPPSSNWGTIIMALWNSFFPQIVSLF